MLEVFICIYGVIYLGCGIGYYINCHMLSQTFWLLTIHLFDYVMLM